MCLFGKLNGLADYVVFTIANFGNYTDRLVTNSFQFKTDMVANGNWISALNPLCTELALYTAFVKVAFIGLYGVPTSGRFINCSVQNLLVF